MSSDWVELRDCQRLEVARVLKSVLAAAGIEAFLPDEHALSLGKAGGSVRLLVRRQDVGRAQVVLESFEANVEDDEATRDLHDIAAQVREMSGGMLALFVGSDHAAINDAASTLAAKSERKVQRIDLASLSSKYLGETGKALDRIFADAKRSDTILFFDEADDLFGKRSRGDTPDNEPRLESLLKRHEGFPGLMVLVVRDAARIDARTRKRADYVVTIVPE